MIPILVSFFFITLFVFDWGRRLHAGEQAQTAADMILLSSLRVRAEGLSRVAARWDKLRPLYGGSGPRGVFVARGNWAELEKQMNTLKRSLSGYQGRITAVIKVAAEANGFPRESVRVVDDSASQLGLSAEPVLTWDQFGQERVLKKGWIKRRWAPHARLGDPLEASVHEIRLSMPLISRFPGIGGDWHCLLE